ncbi:putative pyranose oxidase [Auriculariales sp. MPI-PUGE-AT-0066]|nr:putative pyranose oxidase [Auriculariales sp. MPI-PUGE-AT-0066]
MSELADHPIHAETGISQFDVVIAGSGPIGATYARTLIDRGLNILMVEIGDQESRIPGSHKKNEVGYQKDMDKFVRVIQGALDIWSTPTSTTVIPDLGPSAWRAADPEKMINNNKRNPYQSEYNNIGGAAITRNVGGMSTHWTCATPQFLKGLERPVIFPDSEDEDDEEWANLYAAAMSLIGTSENEFARSIRHNAVLNALQKAYPERNVKALPLACHRLVENSPYVQWHGADNVYGDMFTKPSKVSSLGVQRGVFRLLTNTRASKLVADTTGDKVTLTHLEIQDLLASRYRGDDDPETHYKISGKAFVVACGAIATPQLLAASGFGGRRDQNRKQSLIPNLGRYLTEQPMVFCQVIMDQHLVDWAGDLDGKPEWWQKALNDHRARNPNDPMPIPTHDPEPNVTIPVSKERPWHAQIHRDAFSYGEAGSRVEPRTIVDFRFFGLQAAEESNYVLFENDAFDTYGMPQPTFHYLPTPEYADQTAAMMADMTAVASKVGSFLPGANPTFLVPGLGQHIGGTTRLGHDQADSVADFNSKVYGFSNLFVGGNGVVPTAFAANPTLTAMALAIRGSRQLYNDFASNFKKVDDAITPTPAEWYTWLFNEEDTNFPRHRYLREPHRVVGQKV